MNEAGVVSPGRDAARVRQAKRRRRTLINLVSAAVIVVLVAAFLLVRRHRPTPIAGLMVRAAERTTLTQQVSATGSITAQTGAMVKIGSQITGVIKHLFADVGSQVKTGQVIAELDLPDLAAQVKNAQATLTLNERRLAEQQAGVGLQDTTSRTDIQKAQAGLATAQAALRQAQANATNSDLTLARNEQLYEKGYVAASDVDTARAQAKVNRAQVATAQAQVQQAQAALAAAQAGTANNAVKQHQVQEAQAAVTQSQAQLALAQAQYNKSFIRSPISGTVIQLAQQEGETIAAGLSAPTLIIVADLNRLQVDAYVDETDIGQVRLGQPAAITVDAYPKHSFPGRVVKIASGSTMQNNVVTYDVTIALERPGGLLKPDMTATANIVIARHRDVLTVPVDAVKQDPRGGSYLVVMTKGRGGRDTFKRETVTPGVSDGDRTEIRSGKLKEGDTVVVAGQVPGLEPQQEGGPRFGGPLGFGGGGGRGGSRGGGRG